LCPFPQVGQRLDPRSAADSIKAATYAQKILSREFQFNPRGLVLFSDGASNETDSKSASGLTVFRGCHEHITDTAANSIPGSYIGELIALQWLSKETSLTDNVAIFCDCKAVVQQIRSRRSSSDNSRIFAYIFQLIDKLRTEQRSIKLLWNPGHCGIEQHDRADRLASEALHQQERTFPPLVPLRALRRPIHTQLNALEEKTWESKKTTRHWFRNLGRGDPHLTIPPSLQHKLARTVETRLRLGDCITPRRFNKSTECPHCIGVHDSREHRLFHCMSGLEQRMLFEDSLRHLFPYLTRDRASSKSYLEFALNPSPALDKKQRTQLIAVFAAYLTSPTLLKLTLGDDNIRRFIDSHGPP